MAKLVRYQLCGCFHFVAFSCYRRMTNAKQNIDPGSTVKPTLRKAKDGAPSVVG
jgi:hypothetical protein